MFGFFKKKPAAPEQNIIVVPEIRRMTIGRVVTLDSLVSELLPKETLLVIDTNSFDIVAQGKVELDEGTTIHRFYPEDDRHILQVLTKGPEQEATEFVLFYVHECYYPSRNSEFMEWRDKITKYEFNYGGNTYQRLWFGNVETDQDPVSFTETVYDDRHGKSKREIYQQCMIYWRQVGNIDELLLVNLEEPVNNGDRCVSILVGKQISPNELTV